MARIGPSCGYAGAERRRSSRGEGGFEGAWRRRGHRWSGSTHVTDPGVTRRERAARERAARAGGTGPGGAVALTPQPASNQGDGSASQGCLRRFRDPPQTPRQHEDAGWRLPASLQYRTGHRPSEYIVGRMQGKRRPEGSGGGRSYQTGGFATRAHHCSGASRRSDYAPVRLPRNKPERERPLRGRAGCGKVASGWPRDEAKAYTGQRASVAEREQTQLRLHGVSQFRVHGHVAPWSLLN